MARVKFLNIQVDNVNMNEALNAIDEMVSTKKNSYVVTPNVDHIVKLEDDEEFKKIYEHADLILTDGMPLIWISKIFRSSIKEKISGSDLFPKVCEMACKKGYKIFLLGGRESACELASEKLQKKYPGLLIAGKYCPKFGFEKDNDEIEHIIKLVNESKPDILAVGLGAPKQEKFIYNYRAQLKVPVSLGIGATIDFEAGLVKRAPHWMQKCGMEWFYRMCKEPKRMMKRYLVDDLKIIKIIFQYR